jgi:hypothetical protein
MDKPPASGAHARYRPFGTPGPTGWNDHGDPVHRPQQGDTPGSLSVNDHGTPLPGKVPLLPDEHYAEVVKRINETIGQINSAAHSEVIEKLRTCFAAVGGHGNLEHTEDKISHYVQCYFYARLLAAQGKVHSMSNNDWKESPVQEKLKTDSVEYRKTGEFFQPLALPGKAPGAALNLSYQRIGQLAPRGEGPTQDDRSSYWTEKGSTDGIRDRVLADGRLRAYVSI